MLGLSERQVRVVAPFIGGGFGPKIMMFYPEEVLLPWLAIRLNRPVKWIEDRAEHFVTTTQERSQIHDAEIALAADGRILGIRDEFLHDSGAYDPYGLTVPLNSQCTLLGPYVVPAYDSRFTAVFTTLPIVSPYRGAGRQHGVFVIERLWTSPRASSGSTAPRFAGATSSRPTRSPTTTTSSTRISRRCITTAAITARCSTRRWTRSAIALLSSTSSRGCAPRKAGGHRGGVLCRRHRHRPL